VRAPGVRMRWENIGTLKILGEKNRARFTSSIESALTSEL
jgi:hypothetical protein